MDENTRDKLERAGWRVGDAAEFLELNPDEIAFIETKEILARLLKARRRFRKLTQKELARQIGTSQSRVAKMEAADPGVSLDLLVRGLLAIGMSRQELSQQLQDQDDGGRYVPAKTTVVAEQSAPLYRTEPVVLPPIHPGEMLLYEFLEPLGLSQKRLADHLGWSYTRLNELINGKRRITVESALDLSDAFGTTAEFWLNLQQHYDLETIDPNRRRIPRLKKTGA